MNKYEQQWLEKYELAKKYYEYHGDLKIPQSFKTLNGYEYNEDGIALGRWIQDRRNAFHGKGNCKITNDQIKLLEKIGMKFEKINSMDAWMEKYNLAKVYYEHYGNLEVPTHFKTINGYDYDEDGIALGIWLKTQREAYNGKDRRSISEKRINLLKNIGMYFEIKNTAEEWNKKYELAKAYYEYHGNLEVPQKFKTINGYEYDESGVALGIWICGQRNAFHKKGNYNITNEKIKLLKEIGMIFRNANEARWNRNYELAKKYYEYHGNLKIPRSFKTTNGVDYNKNGVSLGNWISVQIGSYKGYRTSKIDEKQIKLLKKIGINFNFLEEQWLNNYELAKKYYEYHGNLEIPQSYRTINGYEYDENGSKIGVWLKNQRAIYKDNKDIDKMDKNRVKLLNKIGMIWDCNKEIIKQRKIDLNIPSYIYVITNLINNKKYIGQSINPERRFKEHWIKNKSNIDNAMHEYGLSNFKLEILEKTTLEFINEREQYWINKFNTIDPEYGYNVQKGGTTLARFK